MPPSPPAGDAAFLRRVSLDLTGEQPNPEQVRAVPRRHRPREADQASSTSSWPSTRLRAFLGDQARRHAPDQLGPARQRGLQVSILADRAARAEHALGHDRPDAPDRRRRPDPGRRPGQLRARRSRRQDPGRADRPAVPRPPSPLRPVPRPSVRRLDAGRLFRPGRLLRQGPAAAAPAGGDERADAGQGRPEGDDRAPPHASGPPSPDSLDGKAIEVAPEEDPRGRSPTG